MTVQVQLQIANVNLRDPEMAQIIHDNLSDYSFAKMSGITTLTVFSDGNVVADVSRAVRCARHHGIEVLGVYEDRVNANDVARRIGGVSREGVRKWTLDPTFPLPRTASDNDRGSSHRWDWAEVNAWLKANKGIDLDEELPTRKQVAAINAHIEGVHDYLSAAWHSGLSIPAEPRLDVVFSKVSVLASISVTTADWDKVGAGHEHPARYEASEPEYA